MQINNANRISVGNNTFIHHYSWLMGAFDEKDDGLIIRDNTTIGHFAHIAAYKRVIIDNNVLIADRVFITDCTHGYKDINLPIQNQKIEYIKSVVIGEDSWIGENVCICGANIGKHCVIGANSVVISDIPDYSVAVGIPAKVVKRYDFNIKNWISVK